MMSSKGWILSFVFFGILLFCMSFWAGRDFGHFEMRAEAVKAGVAEWKVIDEYGKTKFVWKTLPGDKK